MIQILKIIWNNGFSKFDILIFVTANCSFVTKGIASNIGLDSIHCTFQNELYLNYMGGMLFYCIEPCDFSSVMTLCFVPMS